MFYDYYRGYLYRLDLTGVWESDDGGKHYIRQIGNVVTLYGEKTPTSPLWSHMAHGDIRDNQIFMRWVDVPKAAHMNSGNLTIKISSPNHLQVTQKTGGFGPNSFRRVS